MDAKSNIVIKKKFANLKYYIGALKKQGVVNKKNILDVGCGPGEWMFAASKLNPNAKIVGIDLYEKSLKFATKYGQRNKIRNCAFLNMDFKDLLKRFPPKSFDIILCNSVIEYIDENDAFKTFSCLLKKEGLLIMFCNPGPGFYIYSLFQGLKNLDTIQILFDLNVLILGTLEKYILNRKRNYFVTFNNLKKIANRNEISLSKIETEPEFEFREKFLGLTYGFSCKGIKNK
ncbi:MAG: class I SAM-dependent methyltransferase [Candidatus Aenigmarchaeota archaeon]|nr:class I SAM-dependent methyltransferase [Candidatus Aenigmarchaeota archaeon]